MPKILRILSNVAFWALNVSVFCVMAAPGVLYLSERNNWRGVAEATRNANYIGTMLVVSAAILWLCYLGALWTTRGLRRGSQNIVLLRGLILGTVFFAWWLHLKRQRLLDDAEFKPKRDC